MSIDDPVSGPIPRDKLKELANAPAGKALREIRKFDPWYGHPPGSKVDICVVATREIEGAAFVKAANREEAKELAKKLKVRDFQWETSSWIDDDYDIQSIGVDE
jgi:hypothetical protein